MKTAILLLTTFFLFSCQSDKKEQHLPEATIPETVLRSELDTFNLGDMRVRVEKITKTDFYSLPANPVIDTSEAGNIAADSDYVRRIGDSLIITTKTKEVALVNDGNDEEDVDDYVVFSYAGYLKPLNQFMTSAYYYESYDYVLADNLTGDLTHLWGTPVPSPDGKRFATANSDLQAGFTYNGIQLYTNAHPPVLIAQRELQEWGPEEIRWKDNNTLFVKAALSDAQANYGIRYEYFRLRLE